MQKIVIIFINFGPYHIARIQAAYKLLTLHGWDVFGLEIARDQIEYAWENDIHNFPFKLITLFQDKSYEHLSIIAQIKKLLIALNYLQPDVLAIAGYGEPAMLASLFWAKLNDKKAILLSESKADDKSRTRWKEILKKKAICFFDAALVGGKPQKRYLQQLGMPSNAIAFGYDVVDNNIFAPDRIKILKSPLQRPYFLSIKRFVAKKNIFFLIQSYASYKNKMGESAWDLVICGHGELHNQIENEISRLSLSSQVHLPGFLQQDKLLPYFAHASYFIHSSTQEQWGLVVNEAMAAGLPILISECCGCFEDLLVEGVTGFGFNPKNVQQLTNLMIKVSSDTTYLKEMRHNALEHIQSFSPEQFANGLLNAIDYTLNRNQS